MIVPFITWWVISLIATLMNKFPLICKYLLLSDTLTTIKEEDTSYSDSF